MVKNLTKVRHSTCVGLGCKSALCWRPSMCRCRPVQRSVLCRSSVQWSECTLQSLPSAAALPQGVCNCVFV